MIENKPNNRVSILHALQSLVLVLFCTSFVRILRALHLLASLTLAFYFNKLLAN
jgi:hypothetical protein